MFGMGKPRPVDEYEARGETERVYHAIRQTLRVTGVNLNFRTWAFFERFFPVMWDAIRPNAETRAFEEAGGVALRLATLHPDRVRRLCVMNAVCYDSWPIELMLQFGHSSVYRKASASTAMAGMKQALKQGFASTPSFAGAGGQPRSGRGRR